VATSAQQGERVRLIGILNILGRDDPEAKVRLTIFQEALKQLGWERGRDFKIESRQVGAMWTDFAVTPRSLSRSAPT